ncbi:MAG TPA: ATP-binding protein [Candidatus Saccharimonadales bacterium]|nr:ATP-binding protein [Candidatus Saccharimonadales bacterium]
MHQPRLYLFVGYPGAGKTTISKYIVDNTDAKHIWADVERHKLFPKPRHSKAESDELYEKLNAATDYLLSQGKSVVFDTNFNHKADRDKLREIAECNNAKTVLVWVKTPLKLSKERAVFAHECRNLYDVIMSEQQFDSIATKLEEPSAEEEPIIIDGTNTDEKILTEKLGIKPKRH